MKRLLFIILFLISALNILFLTNCNKPQIYTVGEWEENQQKERSSEALNDAIFWDEAKYHIGETLTVYGKVASAYYYKEGKNDPTFLNIGNPHPNPDRLTVLIWGNNRSNFSVAPEVYYSGKTIYVYGLIEKYEGVPQIDVKSPDQIIE